MMEALGTIARILHPWPWHDYDILAVAAAVVLLFILLNWALDRWLERLTRTQVQRELRARSECYADPALGPHAPAVLRGPARLPDLPRANARGVWIDGTFYPYYLVPEDDHGDIVGVELERVSGNYDYETGVTRPGPQAHLTWMDIERLR